MTEHTQKSIITWVVIVVIVVIVGILYILGDLWSKPAENKVMRDLTPEEKQTVLNSLQSPETTNNAKNDTATKPLTAEQIKILNSLSSGSSKSVTPDTQTTPPNQKSILDSLQ